jgi:hypothetical protein
MEALFHGDSPRQGRVTLSSSEAEFVAASQAGIFVCSLEGSATQTKPTEIWEDNASCIMMSENPTNGNRSRHVDVKVRYLRDLAQNGHVKLVKFSTVETKIAPVMAYSIKLPTLISSSRQDVYFCTETVSFGI